MQLAAFVELATDQVRVHRNRCVPGSDVARQVPHMCSTVRIALPVAHRMFDAAEARTVGVTETRGR
jgi:hypothetical protein